MLNKNVLLIVGGLLVLFLAATGTLPSSVVNVALGILWAVVIITPLWKQAVT